MKKILISLGLVLLISLNLTGCGSKEASTNNKAVVADKQEIKKEAKQDNKEKSKQSIESSKEEAESIVWFLARYLFGSDEGITENNVETFLGQLLMEQGNEGIKSIFIKNLEDRISPEISEINKDGEGFISIKPEYIKQLAKEIFGIDINTSDEMYKIGLCDPPLLKIKIDSFEKNSDGIYEVTAKSIDDCGPEETLLATITVKYECNNGNIKILSFSQEVPANIANTDSKEKNQLNELLKCLAGTKESVIKELGKPDFESTEEGIHTIGYDELNASFILDDKENVYSAIFRNREVFGVRQGMSVQEVKSVLGDTEYKEVIKEGFTEYALKYLIKDNVLKLYIKSRDGNTYEHELPFDFYITCHLTGKDGKVDYLEVEQKKIEG